MTMKACRFPIAAEEIVMSYVYKDAPKLERQPKVGIGGCVALVRYYADVPQHRAWKEGAPVMGNQMIKSGTAIATFVNGKYPNGIHGNHAAFFLRRGIDGFWVIDQWKSTKDIRARYLRCNPGKNRDGTWEHASDNACAFSVIE
jgi:hypothetical protein